MCNVRYCCQIVISSATPRQMKSGEYRHSESIVLPITVVIVMYEEYHQSFNQVLEWNTFTDSLIKHDSVSFTAKKLSLPCRNHLLFCFHIAETILDWQSTSPKLTQTFALVWCLYVIFLIIRSISPPDSRQSYSSCTFSCIIGCCFEYSWTKTANLLS